MFHFNYYNDLHKQFGLEKAKYGIGDWGKSSLKRTFKVEGMLHCYDSICESGDELNNYCITSEIIISI